MNNDGTGSTSGQMNPDRPGAGRQPDRNTNPGTSGTYNDGTTGGASGSGTGGTGTYNNDGTTGGASGSGTGSTYNTDPNSSNYNPNNPGYNQNTTGTKSGGGTGGIRALW